MVRTSFAGPAAVVIWMLLAGASAAHAAIELDPGLWQDTETGTENGQPAKPQVSTDCMTPEDAKAPVKSLSTLKEAGGQCRNLDVKRNGNTVSIVMQCGDPKQMSIDIAASYTFIDRRHYAGTLKSTVVFAGQKTVSDKKVDAKWVGACKK